MKKLLLTLFLSALLVVTGIAPVVKAQEEPKPKKDSVNMDTIAKPVFYYAIEDEESMGKKGGKGAASTIVVIAGAVIIVGGVVFSLLKKKK
ncbi:MAG TPA: hypothetical protein P5320_09610 [Bacteroidales bacterium]|nr:hypothetical protein [Bacteroidales bacterium]HOK74249.1 hypothetical protein [Bacteroidales bacterium]HOM39900.1 hypothetical protein [Bacteroidales bacterium]HOU30456.1 hypothetical protein [Bacteroidales bacterium]HPP92249.1 hypothetical protein [Bacteroidales bacterium]